LSKSLKLSSQYLDSGGVVFPHDPTDNISDELHGLEVVAPVNENDEEADSEVVS
jgi:hypothetical protein